MPSPRIDLPDITLEQLSQTMSVHGVSQVLIKELAPNDNSKNQPYVAKDEYSALNILPVESVTTGLSERGRAIVKASLSFWWIQPNGGIAQAPHAKLILYPQYPEMRLSGFLLSAPNAPSAIMNNRTAGRLLFLGITPDRRIIAWATGPTSRLAAAYRNLANLAQLGVFKLLPILGLPNRPPKESLLLELRRIHQLGWIDSKSLQSDGRTVACGATNCIGYTLEAELGVARNGRSDPDYLGWEIKGTQVTSFTRPPNAKAITLMTPEPTGGYYRTDGVEAFVRRYGYIDRRGRPDRLNVGGIYKIGQTHNLTNLTLTLNGYDHVTDRIVNPAGSLALLDMHGNVAAEWNFNHLMRVWNNKHAQAAYVPGCKRTTPALQYCYAPNVRLGEGTNFARLVSAIAAGTVYYDPGIKLEGVSTQRPTTKKRSQFRVSSSELSSLYESMTTEIVFP